VSIVKATEQLVPDIYKLARKVDIRKKSSKASAKRGFLYPYTEDEYKTYVKKAEHFYLLLFNGKLAGFVLAHSSEKNNSFGGEIYSYIDRTTGKPHVVVRQICIDPKVSKRGWGRRLYRHLFEQIEKSGLRNRPAIGFIWKHPPNSASLKFHEANGWRQIDTYKFRDGKRIVTIWKRDNPAAPTLRLSN
jgi:L-amino acid N-acyltransferase YncA